MPLIAIPFSGADIVATCNFNNIDPDPYSHNITVWVVPDWYLILYDCEMGFGVSQKFVWFSPDLRTEIIRGPLTLLKRKGISCGFDIRSAILYQEVYVVGPFTDAELTPLISAGVALDTNAPYDSASALREYLETRL